MNKRMSKMHYFFGSSVIVKACAAAFPSTGIEISPDTRTTSLCTYRVPQKLYECIKLLIRSRDTTRLGEFWNRPPEGILLATTPLCLDKLRDDARFGSVKLRSETSDMTI
jgi:hypothetical protein